MNTDRLCISLNICRACLSSDQKLMEADLNILSKFNFLLNTNELQHNVLPKTFCEKCTKKIKISANFKKQSEESLKYLVTFLSKINVEFAKFSNLTRQSTQEEEELEKLENEISDDEDNTAETQQEASPQKTVTQDPVIATKEELNKSPVKRPIQVVAKVNEKSQIKVIEKPKQSIVAVESPTASHSVTAHLNLNTSDLYIEDEEQHIEEDDNIFDDKEMYDIMEIESNYVDVDEAGNTILQSSNENSADEGSEFILVNYKSSEDLSTDKDQQFIIEELYSNELDESNKSLRKKNIKRMPKDVIERYAQSTDNHHICTKCVKVFSTRTNLIRHMRSHDGNKPYSCDICNKGFTQSGSLKQHMYIHSGQRPYKCHYCNRAFTQGKTLKFHLRKHMDEKPFVCNVCNSAFRQRDGLKRHLKSRHNIELKYERPNQLDKVIAFVNMDEKSQSTEEKSGEISETIDDGENNK